MNDDTTLAERLRSAPDAAGVAERLTELALGLTDDQAVALGRTVADEIERHAATDPLPGETWDAADPPPREWLIRDMLPAGRLAALYGTGGAGKSTLALQLSAAVMHGGAPLRTPPDASGSDDLAAAYPVLQPLPEERTGKTLWLTWEDERDEVLRRWRMAYHARAIDTPFPDPDRLTLVDMRKIGGPLWGPEQGRHVSTAATWTDAGARFLRTMDGHKLAIIDPLAAAFASSEIDRALVRAFTSALDGEAEAAGCSVLLIGHQPKTTADYSGSTDWQASVRGFLVLETSNETAHHAGDDKARAYRLRTPKQSYAPDGGHLWLVRRWRAPDRDAPAELAWFGARASEAAQAFEANDAARTGRSVRDIDGRPDSAGRMRRDPQKSESDSASGNGVNPYYGC